MKSKEELMDNIRNWKKNKLYQDIVNNNQKVLLSDDNKALLKEIENDIISGKKVYEIIRITQNVIGLSIDDLTDRVIKTHDPMYIYYFATGVKDAPIERLVDEIIDSKNASYIYSFAKDVRKAPIEKLASAIMKTRDIDHIYYFIRDIKNAPVEQMIDEVIRTHNLERIWWLSQRMGLSLGELYCTYSKEKNLATGIVMKKENKEELLNTLIDNMDQGDNLIKLRVYFDFLVNPESSLEEARRCDKEYKEYIANQKDSSDKTLKKTTNH